VWVGAEVAERSDEIASPTCVPARAARRARGCPPPAASRPAPPLPQGVQAQRAGLFASLNRSGTGGELRAAAHWTCPGLTPPPQSCSLAPSAAGGGPGRANGLQARGVSMQASHLTLCWMACPRCRGGDDNASGEEGGSQSQGKGRSSDSTKLQLLQLLLTGPVPTRPASRLRLLL
jgi:hypothetical protein